MAFGSLDTWSSLVDRAPEAAALFFPDGSAVSRRELEDRSSLLSDEWRGAGLKSRRLLLLQLRNGADWMVAFLSCLKSGVVAVFVDPGLDQSELSRASGELGAHAVWDGRILALSSSTRERVLRSGDLAVGKLTSGSTGRPKLFLFSDREMMADGRRIVNAMGIRQDDINLGIIPWGHSYGLGNIVYPLLLQGTPSSWVDTPLPNELAEVCQRVRATVFPTVPTLIRALGRSSLPSDAFASVRLLISAGARLDPEVAATFHSRFGLRPKNFYGSTETGGISFDATGEATLSGRSVGKPLPGVRIEPTRGRRFYVQSDAVFRYRNRHVAGGLGKALVADYGAVDAAGELVLESRAKGVVKIGGRRINPSDVERRLESISGVSQAIVCGVEVDGDTVLSAAVETSSSRDEISQAIRASVPRRLRPKNVLVYDLFPVTSRGKVDLARIRSALTEKASRSPSSTRSS